MLSEFDVTPSPTPPLGRGTNPRLARSIRNERDARLIWSHLCEGDDPLAWCFIRKYGAEGGLERVVTFSEANLMHSVQECLADVEFTEPLTVAHIQRRVQRWLARIPGLDPAELWAQASAVGARLVIPEDDAWSPRLDDLHEQAPLALWVVGDANPADLLRSVAVVGSRAATPYGEESARTLAAGLAEQEVTVISGGAFGIDAAAHFGAMSMGGNCGTPTVALLAGGADVMYPRANADLLRRIARTGSLISETPLGGEPMRFRFLKRNRLIAALSAATVVVEASYRSGALSTARHAIRINRPVGAVPGSITSLGSVGCHGLIRDQQAVCVTSVQDTLDLIQFDAEALGMSEQLALADLTVGRQQRGRRGHDEYAVSAVAARARWDDLDEAEYRVIDALRARSYRSKSVIAQEVGLGAVEIQGVLARLEMHRHVIEVNGRFRRAKSFEVAT